MDVFHLFEKPLATGTPAPDFELPDEQGQRHRLAALRGTAVLLVFYPGDDTFGCRRQLCEIRDSWGALQAADVQVFGVNPQSAESHQSFRQKYHFPFPILVDTNQQVARLYRAAGWIVKRTVVLVGPDGRILLAERGAPSPSRVLKALSAAVTVTPAT
ncbi:MAG: peroxiredoxin [Bryobacterales bacterium]|nr:peroxiredoxin [Bryobacterales bacterium]